MSSEDTTKDLPGSQSFESRVLAGLADLQERLKKLEAKQYDTKPIWQQALAEIVEVRKELQAGFRNTDRQIGVLSKDMVQLRADVGAAVDRLHDLEQKG